MRARAKQAIRRTRKNHIRRKLLRPVRLSGRPHELNIMAFSDCRIQPLEWFVSWVQEFGGQLDLILYAGDDIARFRPDSKTNYFEQLAALTRYGLCAVAGNDDVPKQRTLISGRKVYDVHRRPVLLGDYCILGLEGAPDRPGIGIGHLLHSERAIAEHLRAGARIAGRRRVVLVSHAPPYDCLDTALRFGVRRIGSKALASWLKVRRSSRGIAAVVCGHVHRCGGQERRFGKTVVVNVASHDNRGEPLRIARVHDRPGWVGQPAMVNTGLAAEHDELLRVNGIGPEYASRLGTAGINTVADLAGCPSEVVGRALRWGPRAAAVFPARAQALLERRPIPFGPLRILEGPRVYFDIETDPVPVTFVWLVGCYVVATGEVRQFLASRPDEEGEMLRAFADFAAGVGDAAWLYFSASDFDKRILVPRLQHHGLPVPPGLTRSLDVQPRLRAAVAPPVSSFGLKDVARAFGYRYKHPDLDGLAVAAEYLDCARTGLPIPARLLEYNRDDLLSLHHLVEQVAQLCNEPSTTTDPAKDHEPTELGPWSLSGPQAVDRVRDSQWTAPWHHR